MKVGVVGCGLAGLRAAMLLEALGHDVSLFEARDRPGGRVHTAPGGFEEGAEWVDEDNHRMLTLMREMGIAEVAASPGEYFLHFNGVGFPESKTPADAAADLRAFEDAAKQLPLGETIDDLVRATCTADLGRKVVAANIRTDEGDEPVNLGLPQWLAFRELYAQRQGQEASAYRLEGGGTNFIENILAKLKIKPQYRARLMRVSEGSGVSLSFEGFDATVDAAILALPCSCLKQIEIDPPLSNHLEIQELGFAPAVKARFTFEKPFWESQGWSGYLKTDALIQQTWPDRTESNSLVAYIVGDAARHLANAADMRSLLQDEWQKIAPSQIPIKTEIKNWTADAFARGAFSLASPGSNPVAIRRRDARKVQVAGEFCATWMGFMEGALESAETAVSALFH